MAKGFQTVVIVLALAVIAQTNQFHGAAARYTVAYTSFAPLNSAIFIADADGSRTNPD